MATATYTCSFSSSVAFNTHPSATLSGPSSTIPSGSIVSKVEFEVYCGVSTYNYDADTNMTLTDSSGSSTTIEDTCDTGSSNRIWAEFGGAPDDNLDWNNLSTISLSGTNKLTVRSGYTATLTITYTVPGVNAAPTYVSLSSTETTASTVTLSWSGATAGSNNSISGYFIQYSDSSDGATWNGWAEGPTVSTSATSGSVTVDTSSAGYYRKFKVWTLSPLGYDYASTTGKESPSVLRITYTACIAPTNVTLASTKSTGSNVDLTWTAGAGGTGNAFSQYEVQYREKSSPSTSWGAWTALTTTTAVRLSVSPSSSAGYYRQYRVRTQGAAGSSYYSSWAESANTLQKWHGQLEGFTDALIVKLTTRVKALHMLEIQDRINILRPYYGKSTKTFTTITSGTTSLSGWTNHVLELRNAIDEMGVNHDTWIVIEKNCPNADVIEQIRSIVLSL